MSKLILNHEYLGNEYTYYGDRHGIVGLINDVYMATVFENLSEYKSLTSIEFGGLTELYETIDFSVGLCGLLKANRASHVCFGAMGIEDQDAADIAAALEGNSTLKVLNLHYNSIGDAGARLIAAAIKENETLAELSLVENNVSPDVKAQISRTETRIIF